MGRVKTVLIGAGNIAGMKQTVNKDSKNIITHIQALLKMSDKFEIVGIVDKDIVMAKRLAEKWDVVCEVSSFIGNILSDFEFAVIATNPESHLSVVSEVFETCSPKMILLEKPGGGSIEDALEIDRLCKSNECKLYLNYQRNYSINLSDIHIAGKIKTAECHYVRGLLNDASHAIALLIKLFGTVHEFRIACDPVVSKNVIRDKQGDPTFSAFLELTNLEKAVLVGHDGRDYDVFEMKFWGDEGLVTIAEHGLKLFFQPVIQEEVYGNYRTLSSDKISIFNSAEKIVSIERVYETIYHDHVFEEYTECVDFINVWYIMNKIFVNYGKVW